MGLEGPVCLSIIQRLPHPELGAAGFSVLFALGIWIESPVIDLLATATTLAESRPRYALMRKFVLALMLWVTAFHAFVALTPAYWVVTEQIMGLPHRLAEVVRPGFVLFIPWSAMIGWRRSHQGILIRKGITRPIGFGTLLRGTVMVSLCFGLYSFVPTTSSIVIASIAVVSSVATEMLFIHFISRPAVQSLPLEGVDPKPLTMRRLSAFHAPLTITTMINLLVGPLVTCGLARTPEPVRALAGYQDASSIIVMFRMMLFCLPEVVITLGKDEQSMAALRRFSMRLGLGASVGMLALSLSGLDRLLFRVVMNAPANVADLAHWTFLACSAIPILDAAQSYFRGVLTAQHRTTSRLIAVGAAMAGLAVVLALGVVLHWSGPVLAGSSLTASLAGELAVLMLSVYRPVALRPVMATK
jgi:hypothetical protein